MKQTLEKAAIESCVIDRSIYNDEYQPYYLDGFKDGAEWQSKQSPWISVKEGLPEKNTGVFFTVEWKDSRKDILLACIMEMVNGNRIIEYFYKILPYIVLLTICRSRLSMIYSKPTGMYWNGKEKGD